MEAPGVNKSNIASFRSIVSSIDWLALVNRSSDMDDSCNLLMSNLAYLYGVCFPSKVIRVRDSDPAWMCPSPRLLIHERDRAFSKKQWPKFCRLREEIIQHIRVLKSSHLEKAVSEGSKALRQIGVSRAVLIALLSRQRSFRPISRLSMTVLLLSPFLLQSMAMLLPKRFTLLPTIRNLHNRGQGPNGFPALFCLLLSEQS